MSHSPSDDSIQCHTSHHKSPWSRDVGRLYKYKPVQYKHSIMISMNVIHDNGIQYACINVSNNKLCVSVYIFNTVSKHPLCVPTFSDLLFTARLASALSRASILNIIVASAKWRHGDDWSYIRWNSWNNWNNIFSFDRRDCDFLCSSLPLLFDWSCWSFNRFL